MSLKIRILLMFMVVIYQRSSAKFCMRRFVAGKWVTSGDCGGSGRMLKVTQEVKEKAQEWTVFQRRTEGVLLDANFFRSWTDYVEGFGNPQGNFWLGLEELHLKTGKGNVELEINMITANGSLLVARYSKFRVGPGSGNYTLTVSGYSGNATDELSASSNTQFTTKDADNDGAVGKNCAVHDEGAWWYDSQCGRTNLNGNFANTVWKDVWWWDYYLSFTEMKFRQIH